MLLQQPHLVRAAEIKHHGADRGGDVDAAGGEVGEAVSEGEEAYEAAGVGRGGGDGELVVAFVAHEFDGFGDGLGGGEGLDGFEAEVANGGVAVVVFGVVAAGGGW